MKRRLKVSPIMIIALAGLIFVAGCGGKKVASSEVLATFEWPEKHYIRLSDLEKEVNELPEYKRERYQDKAGREEYLTLMAESRMLLSIAKKNGLDKDLEINQKVDEYLNQTLVEKLTEAEVDKKALANITDLELQKYYEEHMKDYIEPEKVKLTCIAISDKKKIDEVQERVKQEEDFAKIAKELSDKGENVGPGASRGGDTGYFSREDYGSSAPDFVKTAFSLEKGQISDIVEQEVRNTLYYLIFRLEDRQAERQKTFDEVKSDIRNEVESSKKEARRKEWLEELKKKSKLEVFPDRIPATSAEEGQGSRGAEEQKETKPEGEPQHERDELKTETEKEKE